MPVLAGRFPSVDATESTMPPVQKFHQKKGPNIRLCENGTVATRTSSFADGLVFSEKPLQPRDLFLVEIERSEFGWSGSLRIGVTQTDPVERQRLPQFALPDLVAEGTSWVYTLDRSQVDDELRGNLILSEGKFHKVLQSGPWGGRLNLDALQPRDAPSFNPPRSYSRKNSYNDEFQARLIDSLSSLVPEYEVCDESTCEGSRVGVFYTLVNDDLALLFFVMNGECRGPFPFELQGRPLYVVCDVYGCTKTVRIVPLYQVPSLKVLCRDAVLNSSRSLDALPLPSKLTRFLKFESS